MTMVKKSHFIFSFIFLIWIKIVQSKTIIEVFMVLNLIILTTIIYI